MSSVLLAVQATETTLCDFSSYGRIFNNVDTDKISIIDGLPFYKFDGKTAFEFKYDHRMTKDMQFTTECVIYLTEDPKDLAPDGSSGYFFSTLASRGGYTSGMYLGFAANGDFRAPTGNGSGRDYITYKEGIPKLKVVHIAQVADGVEKRLYVDGKLVMSIPIAFGISRGLLNMIIGALDIDPIGGACGVYMHQFIFTDYPVYTADFTPTIVDLSVNNTEHIQITKLPYGINARRNTYDRYAYSIVEPNTSVKVLSADGQQTISHVTSNSEGFFVLDLADLNPPYQILDSNGDVVIMESYSGAENLSGFIEGTYDNYNVCIVCANTLLDTILNTNTYNFNNINTYNVYLEYNGKRQAVSKYNTNMKPGYITGSVNNSCDGTDFKIRVYREDGFFIGDYDIAENGTYEIPNLNVHSSYDVLLYDLNLAVETQVNSRRIPTAYSVTE